MRYFPNSKSNMTFETTKPAGQGSKKIKATTNPKHNLPVAPNLLQQNFSTETETPNQKWVSDITYLWTDEGWLCLAVVVALFSRQVVGWALANV